MNYSSFDNNINSLSQSSTKLLDYLIRKLDARGKSISKYIFSLLNMQQQVIPLKNEIVALLKDVEVDLKQASSAIKALLTENKALYFKTNINYVSSNGNIEQRQDTLSKENSRVNTNNNNETHIQQHTQYNDTNVVSDNTNVNVLHKQLTDISEENDHYDNNNITKNVHKKEMSFQKGKNKSKPYANVNNIIENLKQNKNKLKQAIKQHFDNSNCNVSQEHVNVVSKFKTPQRSGQQYYTNMFPSITANEVIMRIMNTPNSYVILTKQLGNDFIMKLANEKCTNEYIHSIISILDELDKQNSNYKEDNNNNYSYETQLKIPMRLQTKKQREPISLNRNLERRCLSTSFTKNMVKNHNNNSNNVDDGSFEFGIRESVGNRSRRNQNNVFINYANSYGNEYYNNH